MARRTGNRMPQHGHPVAGRSPLARIVRSAEQSDHGRADRRRQMGRPRIGADHHLGPLQQGRQLDDARVGRSSRTRPATSARRESIAARIPSHPTPNQHDLHAMVHDQATEQLPPVSDRPLLGRRAGRNVQHHPSVCTGDNSSQAPAKRPDARLAWGETRAEGPRGRQRGFPARPAGRPEIRSPADRGRNGHGRSREIPRRRPTSPGVVGRRKATRLKPTGTRRGRRSPGLLSDVAAPSHAKTSLQSSQSVPARENRFTRHTCTRSTSGIASNRSRFHAPQSTSIDAPAIALPQASTASPC